jgi:hypothetical protein
MRVNLDEYFPDQSFSSSMLYWMRLQFLNENTVLKAITSKIYSWKGIEFNFLVGDSYLFLPAQILASIQFIVRPS